MPASRRNSRSTTASGACRRSWRITAAAVLALTLLPGTITASEFESSNDRNGDRPWENSDGTVVHGDSVFQDWIS